MNKTKMLLVDDVDPADKVVEALENCIKHKCTDCELRNNSQCIDKVMFDALCIIQKLKSKNNSLKLKLLSVYGVDKTYEHSLRGFVQDLKENNHTKLDEESFVLIRFNDIDELLKEYTNEETSR